jgi:hypothetical protein
MAETLLYHPVHGFKHARSVAEITHDKTHGWHVHADLVRAQAATDTAANPPPAAVLPATPPVAPQLPVATNPKPAYDLGLMARAPDEVPTMVDAQRMADMADAPPARTRRRQA